MKVVHIKDTYSLNSGVTLYLLNSVSQSEGERGGKIPVMGFHSVILKPDSVSRVTPPTTTVPNTNTEEKSSQYPTEGGDNGGSVIEEEAVLEEKYPGVGHGLLNALKDIKGFCVCIQRGPARPAEWGRA